MMAGRAEPHNQNEWMLRTRAVAGVLCAYCLFVGLVLASRLELHQWGFLLSPYELSATRSVRTIHLVAAAALALLATGSRFVALGPAFPRLLLAIFPFVILISADLVAGSCHRPIVPSTGLYMPHPRRGWTLRPNWEGLEWGAPVRTNALALRGPEMTVQKARAETRLVFLGDSVSYGYRVKEEESFPALLRKRLAAANEGRTWSVVNAAVPAYSPWQEVDLLTEKVLPLQPDYIVYVFCLNDVLEKFLLTRFGGYWKGFEPPEPAPLEWSGLFRAARDWHHRAPRRERANWESTRRKYTVRRLLAEPDSDFVARGWIHTLSSLREIFEIARGRGIPIAMVCAPTSFQFPPHPTYDKPPQDVLRRFAGELGIPFLDLHLGFEDAFWMNAVPAEFLFVDPLHLAPAGHKLAAEHLERFMRKLHWIE